MKRILTLVTVAVMALGFTTFAMAVEEKKEEKPAAATEVKKDKKVKKEKKGAKKVEKKADQKKDAEAKPVEKTKKKQMSGC